MQGLNRSREEKKVVSPTWSREPELVPSDPEQEDIIIIIRHLHGRSRRSLDTQQAVK